MLQLIIKDIVLQKRLFPFIIIYALVFSFVSEEMMDAATFISGATIITVIFIMSACVYDDQNQSEMMLISLPIKRGDIVLARYISVYLFSAVIIIGYWLVLNLFGIIGLPVDISKIQLEHIMGVLSGVTIVSALYLPMFFKWGYLKSKIFNVVLFLAIFMIPNIFIQLIGRGKLPVFQGIKDYVVHAPDGVVAIILMGIIIMLATVSYMISLSVFHKRDF